MTFDRLNCDAPPLTTAQKVILANMTAAFLMDDDNDDDAVFQIEALEVVSMTECADVGAARQFIVYGAMDFTMSLTALIGSATTGGSTTRQQQQQGGGMLDVTEYIQSRFNDTESVSIFLTTIRENEELLGTFEMVLSLDVSNVKDVTTTPSVSPTQSPAVTTVTVAPVAVVVTEEPTNSPVESSSSSPVVSVDTNDNTSSAATAVSMKHGVDVLLRFTCIVASGVATWAMLVL